MPSGQPVPTALPPRARLSLLSLGAVFFIIFSGLFCGFLIAHFFPDKIVQVLYGVSTEPPPIPVPLPSEVTEAPPSAPSTVEENARERALSESFLVQAQMERTEPAESAHAAEPVAPQFTKRRKPPPPVAATPLLAATALPASAAPAPTPATTSASSSAPAPGRASPASGVTFSSFLPAAQYPAAEWRKVDTAAGFVDAITIGATGAKLGDGTPGPTDTIDVVGWAGDRTLGMRIKNVIFSMCGKIVGHVSVDVPRPDVAKAVHPNLTPSGWRARLYVGYLPRCPGAALQPLAVIPGTVSVMPIADPIPINLPAEVKLPADAPKGIVVFTPRSVVPAKFVPVDVLYDHVELHRCGANDCAAVGQLPKARYEAHIAEETQDGWVLLVFRDKAGWLPRAKIIWTR